MNNLTIYYGKEKPAIAKGKTQARILGFAYEHKGWHFINTDSKRDIKAINNLVKRGHLEVSDNQFRFRG